CPLPSRAGPASAPQGRGPGAAHRDRIRRSPGRTRVAARVAARRGARALEAVALAGGRSGRASAEERAGPSAAYALGQLLWPGQHQHQCERAVPRRARRPLPADSRALSSVLVESLAALLAPRRALRAGLPRARPPARERMDRSAALGLGGMTEALEAR